MMNCWWEYSYKVEQRCLIVLLLAEHVEETSFYLYLMSKSPAFRNNIG